MEIPRRVVLGWSHPGSVVLDPFVGSGTVPAVAAALGRHGVGLDLGGDYLRLAAWRSTEPKLRAKARAPQPQPTLFGAA